MWLDYRVTALRRERRCIFGERGDMHWGKILASTFRSRFKEMGVSTSTKSGRCVRHFSLMNVVTSYLTR